MKKQRYKHIVLHPGLHKTGTTSIQANCQRHRAWLKQKGIHYPIFHFQGRDFANHSDLLVAAAGTRQRLHGMPMRLNIRKDPSPAVTAFSQ